MPDQERPARPDRDINHVLVYGQSLAVGFEGWPALSLTQPHDSLMLGDSVRPRDAERPEWQPVGEAAFRPLCATVQDLATGTLLTPEQVAGLPRGDIAAGETVLEGAVNFWRTRQLQAGAPRDRNRLLASATGVGARTLEALSAGAEPDLFQRLRDCVRLARATAERQNLSYGVTALLFLQGESNNWALDGGTADTAAYKALLQRVYRDAAAELAQGIAGQPDAPALLMYQTGGAYSSETNSIPQAQLETALETPGCFMVAPSYPVTEKGGHLDANGYRWLGMQFGKVLHRALSLGQAWRPLYPLHAEVAGTSVRITFHVPVPPLVWGRPMLGQGFCDPADRGFTVLDAAGVIPITAVAIVGRDGVTLTLARKPEGEATLRYADRLHEGRGALCDSDPEAATDRYTYEPTTGHYPAANIPELLARPYPLMNWCVAFARKLHVAPPPRTPAWDRIRDDTPSPMVAPPPRGWFFRLWRG